jgi:acyl-CoA thioester hydrolase
MPAFVHRLRVRYNECDAQGHVFNANYLVYFDVALTELWRDALGSYEALTAEGLDLVVAEVGVRFRSPARFDDELEITLEVERLGNTSMVSAIGIARGGETLAEGRIVHIFVRADRLREKTPIPDRMRRMLQCYGVEDPDSRAKSPESGPQDSTTEAGDPRPCMGDPRDR